MPKVSIVIPAYNEERRLPPTLQTLSEQIARNEFNDVTISEVLVVDDGSKDKTIQTASSFQKNLPQLRVIDSGRNYGKGHAIHLGMRAATGDYILIADADMSTPWTELNKLSPSLLKNEAQISIGSRDMVGSQIEVKQSWIREHLGKSFNIFVRMITQLPYKDTQCGFKLFDRTAISPFLDKLKVNDFAWDVEVLITARKHGLKIVEVPVIWRHMDESRVHPVKDGIRMLLTVLKIRFFT